MFIKKNILFFLIVIFLTTSCGTTTIFVNNSNVDIYVNNENKGKGCVEIKRMGVPKKINIEAKYQGKTVGQYITHRKFDFTTCLIGYLTCGVGLIFAWSYPSSIIIPINMDEVTPAINNEQKNIQPKEENIWKRPPNNWRK